MIFSVTIVIVLGHHKLHPYKMANLVDKCVCSDSSTHWPFTCLSSSTWASPAVVWNWTCNISEVYLYTFRFIICFKLIFVYDVRERLRFIFSIVFPSCFSSIYWKDFSFPIVILVSLLKFNEMYMHSFLLNSTLCYINLFIHSYTKATVSVTATL